jgi:hypothetical protein
LGCLEVNVNLGQISSGWIGGGETMQLRIIGKKLLPGLEVLCENDEDDLDGSVGCIDGL